MSSPPSTALAISTSGARGDSWSCRCLGLHCAPLVCETDSSASAAADAQCDHVFLAGKLFLPMILVLFKAATSCIAQHFGAGTGSAAGAVGAVGAAGGVLVSTL